MAIVRTTCTNCGDIRIGAESIVLYTAGDEQSRCVVTCPYCDEVFVKEANHALYAMLRAIGVAVVDESDPDPRGGSETPAPLNEGDLARFAEALGRSDYLAEFAASQ